MKKENAVCVTHSELTTLWNCAWKHRLRYELGLDPAGGADRTGARNIGSLVHIGIAAVYRTIQQMQMVGLRATVAQLHFACMEALDKAVVEATVPLDLFMGEDADEARQLGAKDRETALRCLDLFVEYIALPAMDRYAVLGVEVPFRVPIVTAKGKRSGDDLEGVMDLVLFDRQLRKITLGENKTTVGDASTYEVKLSTDPQMPLYIYALGHIFGPEHVSGGVLLNVIRKAYPNVPNTNQDGTVSVAECDTTRDIYAEALSVQGFPSWWTKAHDALEEAAHPTGDALADPKKLAKAQEAFGKAEERWAEIKRKQETRLNGLPTISRFVYQHEEVISPEIVARAVEIAWNGARLIRTFRRGLLTPWRNGSNCNAFNRLCEYHDACVEGLIEPGELLVKRDVRHAEVEEARAGELPDMLAILDRFGGLASP